ncbi:MAG TPA: YihY/virulence factor BrkB family protein [Micromonosporaceae bacterium]
MTAEAAGAGRRDPRDRTWYALPRALARRFREHGLIDRAAALTYYAVLSVFPGLLVLVSLLGLLGATGRVQEFLVAPDPVAPIIDGAIESAQGSTSTVGLVAVVSLLAAFWSASSYLAAFMRASDVINQVEDERPLWRRLLVRVGLTALIATMLVLSILVLALAGEVATRIGQLLGLTDTAIRVWNLVRWPLFLVLVSLIFETLYWAAPAERRRFRLISPGGLLAVLAWLLVSAGFAGYVANFGAYNRTYGALAGAVIFLVWLWLSNLAILLGAELDAELVRGRSPATGPDEHG